MKSKSRSKTTPVYGQQIEGAANTVSATYGNQLPKVTGITDQLGAQVPGLVDRYVTGDPNVKAAQGYNADVLSGRYLDAGNPQMQRMVDMTNDSVRNGVSASLGTRGLSGGSSHSDLVARALADNETKLRYGDYSSERSRMDQAASQAPALASAQYQPLSIIEAIAQAQLMPAQGASGLSSSIGGLLGQYSNTKQTSSPSIAALIAQAAGNAASGWAQGGFK
jgi:hypothetical protein